jgi:hypothetical protein
VYSVSATLPLVASEPLQPSPGSPPLAVQLVAPGAFQVSVTSDPVAEAELLADSWGGCHLPFKVDAPVSWGSSTVRSVTAPVVLCESAVESNIPENAVANAVAVVGEGAGGASTGHMPGLSAWVLCASPRTIVPTSRLLASNTPLPEAPGAMLPTWLTSSQNVDA